jgi:NADPH:quinone reductase-like Zn-dependent oxidoreductase
MKSNFGRAPSESFLDLSLPKMMQAARVHSFGGPECIVLEQVPIPAPAQGEVLIKVGAAGVGPWDAWIRSGNSVLPQPLPLTLGSDLAGYVVAVGADVQTCKVGESVYGVTNGRFVNAYAQYAIADATRIALRPESLTFAQAASVPVIAVTAWQALFDQGHLGAGQTVLIHGGAGGVGAYAVQFAKHMGANVITTVSSSDVEYVRQLGADRVVDYQAASFEDVAAEVDLVVDLVGGDVQSRSFRVLKKGGRLVSAVSHPDQDQADAHGVTAFFFLVNVSSESLAAIARLIDDGSVKTHVAPLFEIEQVVAIHEILDGMRPRPRGKMVIKMGDID